MQNAIGPLDGRYEKNVEELRSTMTEEALMKARVHIELAWLNHLAHLKDVPQLTIGDEHVGALNQIADVTPEDVAIIKGHEARIKHDVKAVELFVRDRIKNIPGLEHAAQFVQIALTSEDVNNLAYGMLIMKALKENMIPALDAIITDLSEKGDRWDSIHMLSLTHGQPATPSYLEHQLDVFIERLSKHESQLHDFSMQGKFGGAVGNYSAHSAAFPTVDWEKEGHTFVRKLHLVPIDHSTQINYHVDFAELSHLMSRINTVLLDLSRDMWMYISRGVFKQKVVAEEVGSSTMPNKVNPIDFENAEGNIGIANALWSHFADKLPVSRMQRDLSDSTVQRAMGNAFGHTLLAWKNLLKGLGKIEPDLNRIRQELRENPEVVGEAIQTVLRKNGVDNAYDQLKALTRGRKVTVDELDAYIRGLPVPDEDKSVLLTRLDIHR